MRKELLIVALGLFVTAGTAGADVLSVPETEAAPAMALPAKGSTMADVKKKFGDPRDKKGTVGGDTPKHPPINRWDYDGFVVIFEKNRVIDVVVPGAPPRLRSTAGLTPATNAPPPPAAPLAAPAPDAPTEYPVPEAEPIIPEAPAGEAAPQDAPAEAAAAPDAPAAPMEPAPEEAAAPPPAEAPPAETMQPEPVVSPVPDEVPSDGPPTPK
jgi:hypothetical protein